jgi:hypothetical protein
LGVDLETNCRTHCRDTSAFARHSRHVEAAYVLLIG